MTKLLRANLSRLWKTPSFLICLVAAFVISAGDFFITKASRVGMPDIDGQVFKRLLIAFGLAVIFASLYLCADYANGTIRNKLSIGHKRLSVYFANLVVVSIGSPVIVSADMLINFLLELAFGGDLAMPKQQFFMLILGTLCAAVSSSAIYTFFSTLITNRASLVAFMLVIYAAAIFISSIMVDELNRPEISYYEMSAPDENGETHEIPVRNPYYIDGFVRDVYTISSNALPAGQIYQIQMGEMTKADMYQNPINRPVAPLMLYSLGFTAGSTALGVVVFLKKDLK